MVHHQQNLQPLRQNSQAKKDTSKQKNPTKIKTPQASSTGLKVGLNSVAVNVIGLTSWINSSKAIFEPLTPFKKWVLYYKDSHLNKLAFVYRQRDEPLQIHKNAPEH